MLLLIDNRRPPEPPPRRRRLRLPAVSWRVLRWLIAAATSTIAGVALGGLAGSVLVVVGLIATCSAATAAMPYGGGLTEHRQ
jgi:hypothetical protein